MTHEIAPTRAPRSRGHRFILLGLIFFGATGCPAPSVVETRCNSDFDCGASERCAEGVCVEGGDPQPEPLPRDAGQSPGLDAGDVEPDPLPQEDAGEVDAGDTGPLCGDGVVEAEEACDDANVVPNDGCTECVVDDGYFCQGAPSICENGTCTIDGEEVSAGTVSPVNPCERCVPSSSPNAWSTVVDATPCDNAVFCDGTDACSAGACLPLGTSPCPSSTPVCSESDQRCACVDDSCSDGLVCNGDEVCADDGSCAPGAPTVCAEDEVCHEESGGTCVACVVGTDCDSGLCAANECVVVCPDGQTANRDGVCVSEDCPPGEALGYFDGDGDAIGVGEIGCFENPAADNGDCDDNDANILGPQVVFVDDDGDGFTVATDDRSCSAAPSRPPPVVGFRPYSFAITGVGGDAIGNCEPFDAIARPDDDAAICGAFSISTDTVAINFGDFDLDVPPNAAVKGIELTVRRRRLSSVGTQGFTETALRLGADSGPDVAQPQMRSWSTNYESITYGGPTETFGRTWIPAEIATLRLSLELVSSGFGIFDGLLFDAVEVRVYVNEGEDCDDVDPNRFSIEDLLIDEDGDGRSPSTLASSVCVGEALPSGKTEVSRGNDCADDDPSVFEGQRAFFGTPNAQGNYDYDCDGDEEKQRIDIVEACECDPSDGECEEEEVTITPNQDCGTRPTLPQDCEVNGTGLTTPDGGPPPVCSADPPCEVTTSRVLIRCR